MTWKTIPLVVLRAVACFLVAGLAAARPESAEHRKPYEYFANPWSVVGLKDYRDGTRIAPEGTLLLGEGVKCRFLVGESYSPLPTSIVRSLEETSLGLEGSFSPKSDGARFNVALPILHLFQQGEEGLSYEFVVFASPLNPAREPSYDGPAGSQNYLNQVCIRIRSGLSNLGKVPVGISLSRAFSAPHATEPAGKVNRYVCEEKGKLIVLMGLPEGTPAEKVGDSLRWKLLIPEKGTVELYLVLPHAPLAEGEVLPDVPVGRRHGQPEVKAAPGSPLYFAEVHRRTKQFWQGLIRKGTVIGIPEEKPLLTYYASLIYTFIGRDGTLIKPGEGFYDNFYLRDGAFQTHALDVAGFTKEAEQSLAHFLEFQKPDGQFISQRGELDGNGQALWGLHAHYALTGDRAWLREVYPAATKAVSWLERARKMKGPPDSPYFGILFASIADGENLMQTPKHIVGYDFWNLRGVDCVARMAAALGKESDAQKYRRLFQEYRACIEKALKKAGADWFPPTYEGVGTSWGNLTMVHPTRLFDPWHSRVTATLDRVRAGFVEGTIRWGPEERNVIHPYMSTYVTNSEIIRGEREKAVDHFYHFLAHTTSTHGFPEGVYYDTRTAWNNTLPHLWAAAQYIILLRNMLLREDGEDLHLLPAIPVAWLRPKKKIAVTCAPTVFGEVKLAVDSFEGGCELIFSWPRRKTPKHILFHIPPGTAVKRVVQGKDRQIPAQRDVILLPEGPDRFRIEWTLPQEGKDRTFGDYAEEYEGNPALRSKRR